MFSAGFYDGVFKFGCKYPSVDVYIPAALAIFFVVCGLKVPVIYYYLQRTTPASLLLFAQQQQQQQQEQQQFTSLVSSSLNKLLDLSTSHTTTGIMGRIDVSELGKRIQNFAHVLVAQLHVVRGQRHGSSDRRTYTATPRLNLAQDSTFEDHPQIPRDYNLRFGVIEKNVSFRVPGTTYTFDCIRSPDTRSLIFHLQINFQWNVYTIVLQDVPSDTTPQCRNASVRQVP